MGGGGVLQIQVAFREKGSGSLFTIKSVYFGPRNIGGHYNIHHTYVCRQHVVDGVDGGKQ